MTASGSWRFDGHLSSRRNRQIKAARKLQSKKYRQRRDATLVESAKTIKAALQAGVDFKVIFCTVDFPTDNHQLLCDVRHRNTPVFSVEPDVLESISTVAAPQGVVGVVRAPSWTPEQLIRKIEESIENRGRAVVLWLQGIADPGNLGTIVRSAHALGVTGYLCSPGTVGAFNPRAVRASAGSCFFLPGLRGVPLGEARQLLSGGELCVVATSPRAALALQHFTPPQKTLVLLGEESQGITRSGFRDADVTVTIPMVEEAESLNVAAACAIMLYHLTPLQESETLT